MGRSLDGTGLGPLLRAASTLFVRAAFLVALLPYGSTGPFAMPFATLAVALAAGAAFVCWPRPPRTVWLQRGALVAALVVVAYAWLQATGALGLVPPHPIWGTVAELIGRPLPAVGSIAPAATLAALPATVAPLVFFAAALRVVPDDETALAMLRFLGRTGGLVALFGIGQFALAPEDVLFFPKRTYLDSLTAVFVNRNTAATFLGCVILLVVAVVAVELRGRRLQAFVHRLTFGSRRSRRDVAVLGWLFLLAASVVALLLTKSRAGIGCFVVAVLLQVCLLLASRGRGGGLFAPLAAAVAGIAAVGLVFGDQVLYRVQLSFLDDSRFCVLPGLLRTATAAWPYGTGLGTFETAFAGNRSAACGIYGVWDRAHNFFLEGTITLGAAFWVVALPAVAALIATFVLGIRRRRRLRAVPIAGLAGCALLVAHDLFDFSLQIPGVAVAAALMLATCASISLGRSLPRRPASSRASGPPEPEGERASN